MRSALVIAAVLAGAAGRTDADVTLKNGNFYVGYTDLELSGGLGPKIERVYNSKSSHDGIFGFGWGSEYEVHLRILGDGVLVVYENGGGAHIEFVPEHHDRALIEACVAEMVTEATAIEPTAIEHVPEADRPAWRKRLLGESRFRHDEWVKLAKKRPLTVPTLPTGTRFVSQGFGYQTITKTDAGYQRARGQEVQSFDARGHLTRIDDQNGNWITFETDEEARVTRLADNLGRWITFGYNRAGKVERIVDSLGRMGEYKYIGPALVYSRDVEGNIYEYGWSTKRFNLEEIRYQDGTRMLVRYNPVERGETVRHVIDRDGTTSVYSYSGDAIDSIAYGTHVEEMSADGTVQTVARIEYTEAQTATGARYTARLRQVVDDDETVTWYGEHRLPTRIERNGQATTFEYDERGQVTHKTTPTDETWLTYDPEVHKVSRVDRRSAGRHTWSAFHYDNRGNLTFAKDSEGRRLWLSYDAAGRILTVRTGERKELRFEYNREGRPIKITQEGVGAIDVTYTPTGEMNSVTSSGGRNIALQVTSTFQELLDVIRPAGATLSF